MAAVKIDRKSIRWLVLEGLAIVVSILLAFSIDAWWDRREESVREELLLETLLADMRLLQSAREGRDEYADALIEAARRLIDIGRKPEDFKDDRQIDALLADLTYLVGVYDQGLPALDLLFTSGELANIQNQDLRTSLMHLRFGLNVEQYHTRRELEFMDNVFYPFLDANASLAQVWGADDGQPGPKTHYSSTDFPIGREAVQDAGISHLELLTDREFQNLLIRKILTLTSAKGWEKSAYDVDTELAKSIAIVEGALTD